MAVMSLRVAAPSELKNLKRNPDGTYYYDYLLDEEEREINTGNAATDNWLSTRTSRAKMDDSPAETQKRMDIWTDVVNQQQRQVEMLENRVVELGDDELIWIDADVTQEYVNAVTLLNLERQRYEGSWRRLVELNMNYGAAYKKALERDTEKLGQYFSTLEPPAPDEVEFETQEGMEAYLQRLEEIQQLKEQGEQDASDVVALYAMQQGLAEAGQGAEAMATSQELTDTLISSGNNPYGADWISGIVSKILSERIAALVELAGDTAQLGGATEKEERIAQLQAMIQGESDAQARAALEAELNALIAETTAEGSQENMVRQGEYYEFADALQQTGAEGLEAAKLGMGTTGRAITDMAAGAAGMALDTLLGGGSALIPMAVNSYGSQSQQARQSGANLGQAVASGLFSAAGSAAINKLSGLNFGKLTGMSGLLDDTVRGVTDRIVGNLSQSGKLVAGALLDAAASFGGEGMEAVLENLLRTAADSIYDSEAAGRYLSGDYWKETLNEGLKSGLMGMLGSSVESLRSGLSTADDGWSVVDSADETGYTGSNWENSVDVDAAANDFNSDLAVDRDTDYYIGVNGKILPSQYKDWIGTNIREDLLNQTENPELKNAISQLYRKGSFIGDGGTADIIKFEKATGIMMGKNGGSHIQKGMDLAKYIENKILPLVVNTPDEILARKLLQSLNSALEVQQYEL